MKLEAELNILKELELADALSLKDEGYKAWSDQTLEDVVAFMQSRPEEENPIRLTKELYSRIIREELGEKYGEIFLKINPFSNRHYKTLIYRVLQ